MFRSGTNPATQMALSSAGTATAAAFSGNGASLTNLNAANLNSGTVNIARIGTGTKNSTTFLRGDNVFATVAGAVTHSARLATTLNTGGNTNGVNVFQLANIVPGQYMVMISGR